MVTAISLSQAQITDLLYRHDVAQLRTRVYEYLKFKEEVWLLFDNIDKGWPTHGLKAEDLVIIRTLIDATRKIERELGRAEIPAHTIIFLRNDVYELLVQATPDRGKETRANVDWSEPDLLREVIRRRIVYGQPSLDQLPFSDVWRRLCVPLIDGEESSQYLIDRSLMRPRALIELIGHCRGFAVNLRHDTIMEADVASGLKAFSSDLLRDISLEIRDVLPTAAEAPYGFIGAPATFGHEELLTMLREAGVQEGDLPAVYQILLWFAFLGAVWKGSDAQYIYSFSYDFKLFMATINKRRPDGLSYLVNPAFWAALGVSGRVESA
jgi:hypothetical protein